QLALALVDGLTVAQPRVVRFGNGPPTLPDAEDCDNVVHILDGFEVEEEGREAEHAEGGGRKDGAFEAVGRALPEHAARRPRGQRQMVRHGVERALYAPGSLERAQAPKLERGKASDAHPARRVTGGSAWAGGGSEGALAQRSRRRVQSVSPARPGSRTARPPSGSIPCSGRT